MPLYTEKTKKKKSLLLCGLAVGRAFPWDLGDAVVSYKPC